MARTATSVRELPADKVSSAAEATDEVADLLPSYEAVSFRSALTAAEAAQSVEVPVFLPQPGEYLLEPAPAIVRSHLVAEFAQSIGAQLLDEHLAYLRSAEPVEHPLVACYEVLEELPLQEKQLKRWVREQGFTALTIKKRGVDIVPEQLRARLLGSAGSKPSKKKQKRTLILLLVRRSPHTTRQRWSLPASVQAGTPAASAGTCNPLASPGLGHPVP